jgi:glutathione S-transferase
MFYVVVIFFVRLSHRFIVNPETTPLSHMIIAFIFSLSQTACRLGSGVFANGYKVTIEPRSDEEYTIATLGEQYQIAETSTILPKLVQTQPLILYEFEACPFCRKVRESVSILSLTVTFRPCPKNGNLYRREIKEKYGTKATFPFLMDPNTGVQMFESDAIVEYLFLTYGDGTIPWTLLPLSKNSNNPIVTLTAGLGLLFRAWRGATYKTSNPPPLPLQVVLYEGSPFCKLVRETLCELELEHTQVSCPRGSPNRQRVFETYGRFQVPYLEDPNSGVILYESEAIVEYLQRQYGVLPSPVKYL